MMTIFLLKNTSELSKKDMLSDVFSYVLLTDSNNICSFGIIEKNFKV